MKAQVYKTDKRLWLIASLGIFIPLWFGEDVNGIPHWGLFPLLFAFPDHAGETLGFLTAFSVLFGVPAVLLGWIIQCVIVMLKFMRTKPQNNRSQEL